MDIFKLDDVIHPKEITQKEREQKRSPGANIPFDKMIRPAVQDRSPLHTIKEVKKVSGEDTLIISQESKTAYYATKLIMSVINTPDVREDKIIKAQELIKNKTLLTQKALDITAERLLKRLGIRIK